MRASDWMTLMIEENDFNAGRLLSGGCTEEQKTEQAQQTNESVCHVPFPYSCMIPRLPGARLSGYRSYPVLTLNRNLGRRYQDWRVFKHLAVARSVHLAGHHTQCEEKE